MKILLFGGSGRLGARVWNALYAEVDGVEIVAPTHTQMPVESKRIPELIEHLRPNLIINCSAMNGLENCRENPRRAMEVNCMAPGVMAAEAMKRGCGFIHFSTDYAEPAVDVYGATKYAGEKLAMLYENAAVFRLMSIYDITDMAGSLSPVKLALEGKCSQEKKARVLYQITAPTFTGWIAQVIAKYVASKLWLKKDSAGLFCLSPYGQESKLHFAEDAIDMFLQRRTVGWVEEGNDLKIPRPTHSVFDFNAHSRRIWLLSQLGLTLPSIRENLEMAYRMWQSERHAGVSQSASIST